MEIKTIHAELKALCQEIINTNDLDLIPMLEQSEKIYEKLLLAEYLSQRQEKLNRIAKRLEEQIASTPLSKAEIKDPSPEDHTQQIPPQGINVLQDEIKVLPHPEGPPPSIKQHDLVEAIIEIQKEEVVVEVEEEEVVEKEEAPIQHEIFNEEIEKPAPEPVKERKQSIAEKAEANSSKKSLNQKLSNSSLKIGLNDRIAFVKHLFNGSQEDFNRVISQVNSFQGLEDAEQFIDHIVKPEYSWASKEEYEERFMEIVRGKF